MAYLRVIVNEQDQESIKRIINYPTRAIGKTTTDKITVLASEQNITFWEVLERIREFGFTGRTANSVEGFVMMIKSFRTQLEKKNAYDVAEEVGKATGIVKELYKEGTVEDLSRYENVQELLNAIKEFTETPDDEGELLDKSLGSYLQQITLLTDADKNDPENQDVVTLMTIHASKGLEFDVVHMPGLITAGLPGSNRTSRCVPPDGVIEGSVERSTIDTIKAGHEEEEECKFFVGTSRAKERLMFYASSIQPGGRVRKPSRYINTVRSYIQQNKVSPPARFSPEEDHIVPVHCSGGLSLTDSQLSLYDRCPRRFLYTHILALGGRRTQSAFLQMHSAVRDVLDWISASYSESNPTIDEINDSYERAWRSLGPVDHGYAEDYRKIGHRLVEFLMETRTGKRLVKPEKLKLSFSDGEVIVLPDEITLDPDGNHSIRRIKTGKLSSSSDKFDDIEYTILSEAAQQHFGADVKVEAVHLASETLEPVTLTSRKKKTRLEKSEGFMSAIVKGEFSRSPNVRACPTCPSFFICGKVPTGSIEIKNNK